MRTGLKNIQPKNYPAAYRAYKKHLILLSQIDNSEPINPIVRPIEGYQFNGSVENVCCSFFGCRKILTITERLFGERCIHHPKNI